MYLKIIRKKLMQNGSLFCSCIDPTGKRVLLQIMGMRPYCFIRKLDKNNISFEEGKDILKFSDEGFTTLKGEPCLTVYMKSWYAVRNFGYDRHETVLQSDVAPEVAMSIKYDISSKIVVPDSTPFRGGMYHTRISDVRNMDEQEILDVVFPDSSDRVVFLDIEVLNTQEGFPDAENPDDAVVCVVVDDTVFLLEGDHPVTMKRMKHHVYSRRAVVRVFHSERQLLEALHRHLMQKPVSYIVAWNSDFDENWLKDRSKYLDLTLEWDVWQWVDIQRCYAHNLGFSTSRIKLKEAFLLLYQYKKKYWRYLPDIFQDYFVRREENGVVVDEKNKEAMIYEYVEDRTTQSGGDVTKMYREGRYLELVFYNLSDVYDMIALRDVASVDGYIAQAETLELVRTNDVFVHTHKIDPTPLKLLMTNKIASNSMNYERRGEEFTGAIVHEPKTGEVLENVFVMDFSRFYISIILARQVSPERYEGTEPRILQLPDGSRLERPMYFLTALAKYLIQEREKAEKGLSAAKKAGDTHLIAHYASLRTSWKMVTSGLWGYIATPSSRYYHPEVPKNILDESRRMNLLLKKHLNEQEIAGYRFEVVYGDTDSSFARILGKVEEDGKISPIDVRKIDFDGITHHLNDFLGKVCEESGYPLPIGVKPEKLFDRLLLVSKKFYYGRTIWEDGEFLPEPGYYIKGMQTIRSDHSQFGKDFQYAVIMSHLNEGLEGIVNVVKTYYRRFEEMTRAALQPSDALLLATPISFRDAPEEYAKKETGYAIYAKAAIRWNQYVGDNSDEKIGKSMKAYRIPVKSVAIPELRSDGWLVFKNPVLIDWEKVRVDTDKLLSQNIIAKIKNIFRSLGYNDMKLRLMLSGEALDNGMGGI